MKLNKAAFLSLIVGLFPIFMISCNKLDFHSKPKCLAVGSARTVMITENSEAPGTYIVVIKGSNPTTVLLTQRPNRKSKSIETAFFLKNWENSYKTSAPNVTFTSVTTNRTTTNVLVLGKPNYDPENQTITFNGKALTPKDESVQTGIFNNVTITYDSQIHTLMYEAETGKN